ncbi:ParB/RepB/Spo0J family partition protein [Roseateles puraquae]|uniref:ParB/RepB/Spo0J family partition protein n=1 Tax=Roseateles puraquae TaxID=431059 RepID=UPI0031DEF431
MSKTSTPTTRASEVIEAGVPPAPPETHQEAGIALRAQTEDADLQYMPLSGLRLDERNVRKDEPTESEIDELADLIDAQGLLQNLTVVAYDSPRRGTGRDKRRLFTHGVVAGGRRLRALNVLVKRGRLSADYEVLCAVVPAERAIAVSMAENQGQKPMSVADTVQAFADMVAAGAGIEDIAVCFGLTPLTVRRRVRLATVSPKLFALYRAGGMNMDQLMALSLADTHDKQEGAWECLPLYNRSANAIRSIIVGEGVSDSIVKFVGLEAYEQAGGHVIRDLFSDDDGVASHVGDPELMQRLATERLGVLAQQEQGREGWAWVEVAFDYDYGVRQRYCEAPTSRREPSAKQAHDLGELERQKDDIENQLEAAYDADDPDDDSGELIDALEEQSRALQVQIDAIETQLAYCPPEVLAQAGALLTLGAEGQVVVKRNLMRQEDYKAWRASTTGTARSSASAHDDAAGGSATKNKGLSAALCQELTAFKTEALQVALVRRPQVALAALAHSMAGLLLYEGVAARYESPTALGVSVRSPNWQLLQIAPALADSAAHRSLNEVVALWRARLPADPTGLMEYLLAQSAETLQDLLVLCAALTTHALHGTAHAKPAQALAGAAGLDMADWWEATGDTYLGRVPKSLIAQALVEAGEVAVGGEVEKLKKADAVSRAQAALAGKRWLPELLRSAS